LVNESTALRTKGSFLQVYLRPFRGKEEILRACYLRASSGEAPSIDVTIVPQRAEATSSGPIAQATQYLKEVADELEYSRGLLLCDCSVDFIVDDNEQAWLSHVSSFTYISANTDASVQQNAKKDNSPTSVDAYPAVSAIKADVVAATSSSSRPSTAPISCSFIELDPRDGIYKTSLCVDELPGLRAWIPQKNSTSGTRGVPVGHQWVVDLDEYTRPLASPVEALEQIRENRSRLSHQVPMDLVKIVTRCENILLGGISCRSTGELVSSWKRAVSDAEKTLSSGSDAENCLVCGNLNEVLEKLTALMHSEFHIANEVETFVSRPRSVPASINGTGETVDNAGVSGRGSNSKSKGNAPPSSSSNVPDSDQRLLRAHSSQDEKRVSSGKSGLSASDAGMLAPDYLALSRKDNLRAADQLEPLDNKIVDSLSKAGQKYDQVNAIYLEEPLKKNASRITGAKGKKLNDKLSQQKSFGKNSMQAPPNLELIAKFAVEKEK